MRLRTRPALLGVALTLAACSVAENEAVLDTEDQKASYAIGRNMGTQLVPAQSRIDVAAFMKGVTDAMAEMDPAVPQADLDAALQAFSAAVQEEEQARRDELAQANLAEGEAYLAENGAKEGVVTTESGLQYEVLTAADGERPDSTATVTIHYRGSLIDGTEFDSSYERGEPATFPVRGVIAGFSEALQLMPVGSKYRISIPGELGYGAQGAGQDIGPNATLIFEIEMLEIASN